MQLQKAYKNKRIWVSGHTGFKGAWLTQLLINYGAEVYGFSLQPPTNPSLFEQAGLAKKIHHEIGDIRDKEAVAKSIAKAKPDFIFHLAAQPIVRLSYEMPFETYDTNVMGTVNVLEDLRSYGKPCVAIFVTSDKCYHNREWLHAYHEHDALGGSDVYSSSKAAAELAVHSWRTSFFSKTQINIATVRAGNVIGGGDWAPDRIIPDCIRALAAKKPIGVRNKVATRPWQHVLEPLVGYLWLGAVMSLPAFRKIPKELFNSAFNFGPGFNSNRTVEELVTEVLKNWPGKWKDESDPNAPYEAKLLNVAIDKAVSLLDWRPLLNFEETVKMTVDWYKKVHAGGDAGKLMRDQIKEYEKKAKEAKVIWY